MRRTAKTRNCVFSLLAIVLAIGTAARSALGDPKTYDYSGRGHWTEQTTRPSTSRPTVDPFLDRIQRLMAEQKYDEAYDLLVPWVVAKPNAPDKDRSLFFLANIDYQRDQWIKAFYQLDEIVDKFNTGPFFYPALELQYHIADGFLNGHKLRFLGLPVIGADDEAVDMLFRIQERVPGSPLAEKALLRTADFYFSSSQFDLSGDAYAAYARSYPRGRSLARVRMRQALSSYAQFRGYRYDVTPLIDARAQFEEIKVQYPQMASELNVQKFIDEINATLAQKLLQTAEFFARTSKPRAEVYTYRQLVATYPSSREAQTAKERLVRMPAWALKEVMPASTRPAEPPAQPLGPPRPVVQ